jgi:hypothetical protein
LLFFAAWLWQVKQLVCKIGRTFCSKKALTSGGASAARVPPDIVDSASARPTI